MPLEAVCLGGEKTMKMFFQYADLYVRRVHRWELLWQLLLEIILQDRDTERIIIG